MLLCLHSSLLKMKQMSTLLYITITFPCWISCQLTLSTQAFVENRSVNISQCSNRNLVFSQTTRNLITCSHRCAANASCVIMIYIPAEMTCKGCRPLDSVDVPDHGNPTIPSAEIQIYRKFPKKCEDGWLHFQDKCYWIGSDPVNHIDLVPICEQKYSHVVHIDTAEENTFLFDAFNQMIRTNPTVIPIGTIWPGSQYQDRECLHMGVMKRSTGDGLWRYFDTNDTATFVYRHQHELYRPYVPGLDWCAVELYEVDNRKWENAVCHKWICRPICEKNI